MADSNFSLKAVVQEAKLTCRQKLGQLQQHFEEEERLTGMANEADAVFKKFDQPELWEQAIEYNELELLQKIIQLSEAPENDLEATAQSMDALLNALRGLAAPRPRSRSFFGSDATALNIQMMDALLDNRRIIDDKMELLRSNEKDPHEEPGFTDMESRQQTLIERYQEALENNKVRTKSTDLRLIKELFGRAFSAIDAETPVLKFIEVYSRYNQEIEKRCPQTIP